MEGDCSGSGQELVGACSITGTMRLSKEFVTGEVVFFLLVRNVWTLEQKRKEKSIKKKLLSISCSCLTKLK